VKFIESGLISPLQVFSQ